MVDDATSQYTISIFLPLYITAGLEPKKEATVVSLSHVGIPLL
jgi:hypothetical protein